MIVDNERYGVNDVCMSYENSKRMSDADLIEYSKKNFRYDPEEGILYRKVYANGSKVGKVGFLHNGRLEVNIGYRTYFVHRICYLMHYGECPEILDHIDRNKTNNKITNLRPATHALNMANKDPRPNKTGYIGVSLKRGKYTARFQSGGKRKEKGGFTTAEAAAKYRDDMSVLEYGENIGLNFKRA